MRSSWLVSIWLVVVTVSSPSLAAQLVPGHAYVPLDHWSMPFLEHLIERRILDDPSPMVRPWTADAIRSRLTEIDRSALTSAESDMVERLLAFFQPDVGTPHLVWEAAAGIRASTHARRHSNLRDSGDDQLLGEGGVNMGFQAGPLTLVMHPVWDPNFRYDPDYGGREVPVRARFAEAYAGLRSEFVSVDVGRLERNWGPVGFDGLLVSAVPYAYDHVYARLGTRTLYLQSLIAQLDDMANQLGEQSRRFWVAHRLTVRPVPEIDLAIWEGSLISGPGRNLELWWLNPISIHFQTEDERVTETNVVIGGDMLLRLGDVRVAGSLTVDDLQLFSTPALNDEPPSYALSGSVTWPTLGGSLWFGYTQVSNLSYRTPDPSEALLVDANSQLMKPGAGLARNFTDYDQLTVRYRMMPWAGVLVSPEITLLRQGEGDLREPYPPAELNPVTPTIFAGIVERTWRVAGRADVARFGGLRLSLDAGLHLIQNAGHVDEEDDVRGVATLQVRYTFGDVWRVQ